MVKKRFLQKSSLTLFLGALLFSVTQFGSTAQIPRGYVDGRADAKYGTYASVVDEAARPYQRRLQKLENQAYGLAHLIGEDPVSQSEKVLKLESKVLALHLEIASDYRTLMSDFSRKALLYGTVRVYEDVRHHGERLYENMIRYIDNQLPGPNGQQIRIQSPSSHHSLYRANYRSDHDLTPEEREASYQKLLAVFLAKGGSLSECKKLTNKLLHQFGSYTRVEYVWLDNGEIIVTEGKAGHVLLARGKDVRAAGQIVFLKNDAGKFTLAVVSNASGNYKADLSSAQEFADALGKRLKLDPEFIVLTKGEPLSTQGIKVYQKGQGVPEQEATSRTKAAERASQALLNASTRAHRFSSSRCGAVFAPNF